MFDNRLFVVFCCCQMFVTSYLLFIFIVLLFILLIHFQMFVTSYLLFRSLSFVLCCWIFVLCPLLFWYLALSFIVYWYLALIVYRLSSIIHHYLLFWCWVTRGNCNGWLQVDHFGNHHHVWRAINTEVNKWAINT